jgi:hypothetical protein
MADTKIPNDWRGEVMNRIRELIKEADSDITEEVKYKTATNPDGVFVWYKDGMISTGETYKEHLRLGFSKGPQLKEHDSKGLINSHRAIIIKEGAELDEKAFIDLVRAAVSLNAEAKAKKK